MVLGSVAALSALAFLVTPATRCGPAGGVRGLPAFRRAVPPCVMSGGIVSGPEHSTASLDEAKPSPALTPTEVGSPYPASCVLRCDRFVATRP